MRDAIKDIGLDNTAQDKAALRVDGVTFTSFRESAVYTGHLPLPMASFSYQMEGNRLVVAIDVTEAVTLMTEGKSIAETGIIKDPEIARQMLEAGPLNKQLHDYDSDSDSDSHLFSFVIVSWLWVVGPTNL